MARSHRRSSFVKAHTNNQISSNILLIRNSTGRPPFYPLYSFDLDALNFTNGLQTIPVTPLNLTRSGLSNLPDLTLAACNGLMLIVPEDHEKPWAIWNPLTHERLELPRRNMNSDVVGSGLGYDYAADDYKAVVIDCPRRHGKYVYRTHIYSLKSDSWRKIGNYPCDYLSRDSPSVFLNGALHWRSKDIVALDLGTENYRQLQFPPLRYTEVTFNLQLDVLDGCLILSDYIDDQIIHFDVWMMKDYGAEDSWMKLFCLNDCTFCDLAYSLRPLAYTKNKKQIFLQKNWGFVWFDVESDSVKMVSIHGLCRIRSTQICPASIFRLHDNCGVSGSIASKRRRMRKWMSKRKRKMKMADTKLTFYVTDHSWSDHSWQELHDGYYSPDSDWYADD